MHQQAIKRSQKVFKNFQPMRKLYENVLLNRAHQLLLDIQLKQVIISSLYSSICSLDNYYAAPDLIKFFKSNARLFQFVFIL